MKRLLLIVALGLAPHVSRAQSAADTAAGSNCPRSVGVAAPYARCALSLDGDYLYMGMGREPVAHGDGNGPVALSRFVVGDSARHYALRYERDARRGMWLQLLAGTMVLGSSVKMASTRRCACTSFWNQHPCPAAERVMYGGLAVDLAGYLFKSRAEREGSWALAWHNRALSR